MYERFVYHVRESKSSEGKGESADNEITVVPLLLNVVDRSANV